MNDTVTRLMELADNAINAQGLGLGCLAQDYRQALQDELQKLFTPLNNTQATKAANVEAVYAPDGFIRRTPIEYRNELQAAKLAGIRYAKQIHSIK